MSNTRLAQMFIINNGSVLGLGEEMRIKKVEKKVSYGACKCSKSCM